MGQKVKKGDTVYMADVCQGEVSITSFKVLLAGERLVRVWGWGHIPTPEVDVTPEAAVERTLKKYQDHIRRVEAELAEQKQMAVALEAKWLELQPALPPGADAATCRAYVEGLKSRRATLDVVLALLPQDMVLISRLNGKSHTVAELRQAKPLGGETGTWFINLGRRYGLEQRIQVSEETVGGVFFEDVSPYVPESE